MIPAEREFLDQLQNLIAANTVRHSDERRIITPEIFKERLQHYLAVGKKELEAIGPEPSTDSSNFTPKATIFGSLGEEANICAGWHEGQKRRMMWALSEVCRIMLAQGVIIRNVMTGANMQKIAAAMELNCPDPRDRQKVDYFEERMWKWIKQNYGRARLAALPAELRWDGLMVAGFGPKLPEIGAASYYEWENGKIKFVDVPGYEVRISLIPRWWQ